jgi:hypothetical protein
MHYFINQANCRKLHFAPWIAPTLHHRYTFWRKNCTNLLAQGEQRSRQHEEILIIVEPSKAFFSSAVRIFCAYWFQLCFRRHEWFIMKHAETFLCTYMISSTISKRLHELKPIGALWSVCAMQVLRVQATPRHHMGSPKEALLIAAIFALWPSVSWHVFPRHAPNASAALHSVFCPLNRAAPQYVVCDGNLLNRARCKFFIAQTSRREISRSFQAS